MNTAVKTTKKVLLQTGYLVSMPFAFAARFFQLLLNWEAPGIFALGLMIYCIYGGWRDIHNGAFAVAAIFKYGLLFSFVGSLGSILINFILTFLLACFMPMLAFHNRCKNRLDERRKTMDDYIYEMRNVPAYGMVGNVRPVRKNTTAS